MAENYLLILLPPSILPSNPTFPHLFNVCKLKSDQINVEVKVFPLLFWPKRMKNKQKTTL